MKPRSAPRLKKHRITLTLTLKEGVSRAAAQDYVLDSVATMHGCHLFRYGNYEDIDVVEADEVLCGEVAAVKIDKGPHWRDDE